MSDTSDFKTELLQHIPPLRAFSRSFCGATAKADDLVQETLLKAWSSKDSFMPGTNMRAWLFTILRNTFYSDVRRRAREVEDPEDSIALKAAIDPGQHEKLELRDLRRALAALPLDQREAIVLVGVNGCSYAEAATICGCAVGTIKSRVSRARQSLKSHLTGLTQLVEAEGVEPPANKEPRSQAAPSLSPGTPS